MVKIIDFSKHNPDNSKKVMALSNKEILGIVLSTCQDFVEWDSGSEKWFERMIINIHSPEEHSTSICKVSYSYANKQHPYPKFEIDLYPNNDAFPGEELTEGDINYFTAMFLAEFNFCAYMVTEGNILKCVPKGTRDLVSDMLCVSYLRALEKEYPGKYRESLQLAIDLMEYNESITPEDIVDASIHIFETMMKEINNR